MHVHRRFMFAVGLVGLTSLLGAIGTNLGTARAADPLTTYLTFPEGVAVNGSDVYISDTGACVVRKLSAGSIATFAGTGNCSYSGDGAAATSATLNHPRGLAADSNALYIADTDNCRVRKVTFATGVINLVAGNGTCAFSGDFGSATGAQVNRPRGLDIDTATGDIWIADTDNNQIRQVSGGVIYPLFGASGLSAPRGVVYSGGGAPTLYIADTGTCTVKRFRYPTMTVLAGVSGSCGSGSTLLNAPTGIVRTFGTLYVTDTLNCRTIVMPDTGGFFSNYASTGTCGFAGDGTVTATFYQPTGLAITSGGSLYVADTLNCRIRLMSSSISTVAGGGCAPDLTIVNAYGDTRAWPGESIEHRLVVKNQGIGDAPATSVNVYLSTNTILDAGDVLIATASVPALTAGSQAIVSYTYTVNWTVATGRVRTFIASVDPGGLVAESNEANNTRNKSVGVSLLPYDVTGDGVVSSGDLGVGANAVGSRPGDLIWNPDADQPNPSGFRDGVITSGDLGIVAAHFGDSASHAEAHWFGTVPVSGVAPLNVTFNYQSHYFEGTIALLELDFDGDGTWDLTLTGGTTEVNGTTPFLFSSPGTYVAKARATDSNGYADIATITITVS